MSNDQTDTLQATISDAAANKQPLCIRGGGSKQFLGRRVNGITLSTARHQGIINYEPGELILTARSGTSLKDIKKLLAEQGQMLAFEPPSFGAKATLGGTIATGLSGPRRPYSGAARDFVLGTRLINGRGQIMRFGGEVMKNVAGYDVSRLMTGAHGTLGLILDVSLKILPKPESERTLVFECSAQQAITRINQLAGQAIPLSAACHLEGQLYLRLSGMSSAVTAAASKLGGDSHDKAVQFWRQLREHQLPAFKTDKSFWRLSVPATTPTFKLGDQCIIDWGGALRWVASNESTQTVHAAVRKAGGHATLFRNHDGLGEVFQPLAPGVKLIHKNLKAAFDPMDILNPGRMYLNL